MPFEVQSKKIDILFVQFGLNDCNFWKTDRGLPRVSPESFESNLIEIIQRSKRFNIKKIILLSNYPVNTKKKYRNNKFIKNNEKYNSIIKKCSRKKKVFFIDVYKYFKNSFEKSFLNEDGIHLNQKGNKLYFDSLKENVVKIITNS